MGCAVLISKIMKMRRFPVSSGPLSPILSTCIFSWGFRFVRIFRIRLRSSVKPTPKWEVLLWLYFLTLAGYHWAQVGWSFCVRDCFGDFHVKLFSHVWVDPRAWTMLTQKVFFVFSCLLTNGFSILTSFANTLKVFYWYIDWVPGWCSTWKITWLICNNVMGYLTLTMGLKLPPGELKWWHRYVIF